MEVLADKQALKSGLTPELATETHWAVSSPEVYRLLVCERGWPPSRYEDWLAETTATLLLCDP